MKSKNDQNQMGNRTNKKPDSRLGILVCSFNLQRYRSRYEKLVSVVSQLVYCSRKILEKFLGASLGHSLKSQVHANCKVGLIRTVFIFC